MIHAVTCIICIGLNWRLTAGLQGTEFSGGTVTGSLLSMSDLAVLLFVVSLFLVFWMRRTAAALMGIGALLCLPLSLLILAPGLFRKLVGGLWSVPLQSNFTFNKWVIAWFLALLASLVIAIGTLVRHSGKRHYVC